MNKRPKKHHHLSRFYIEGFSEKNSVCVFSKVENKFFLSNAKDVFAKDKYYYLDNFENPLMVEELLGEIESKTAPIVKRICNEQQCNLDITNGESDTLLLWLSWLYISRPHKRVLINNHLTQLEQLISELFSDKGVSEDKSEMMQYIKDSKGNKVAHIRRTVNLHESILLFFKALQWR
jgi:hypothetical protein